MIVGLTCRPNWLRTLSEWQLDVRLRAELQNRLTEVRNVPDLLFALLGAFVFD